MCNKHKYYFLNPYLREAVINYSFLFISDNELHRALYDGLDYIEACLSTYALWNGFPVGMKLVLGFFSLYSVYTIAVMQFFF